MPLTPLRGRAGEMAAVTAALRHAGSGGGCVIVVEGPPGIGKSRLLAEAADHARGSGFAVATAQADELDQLTPFAPLLLALTGTQAPIVAGSQFQGLSSVADQRLWVTDRLAGLLEAYATGRSVLVIIDDLQWCDPASLFALRVLPQRLAGSPVAWLLAHHGGPVPAPVGAVLRPLLAHGAIRLRLDPLSADAVRELAADLLQASPGDDLLRLTASSQGNPFLAVELLRGLQASGGIQIAGGVARLTGAPLPPQFRHVIRERLGRLDGPARRLLAVGSVLGRSFTVADAAALLGVSAGQLLPAVQDGIDAYVLTEDQAMLAFRHDLLRQAVYADLAEPVRRALHRDAATQLMATGGTPAAAAAHLLAGVGPGDPGAARQLTEAADSVAATAPIIAAQLMTRALELTPPGSRDRPATAARAVTFLRLAGQLADVQQLADEVLSAGEPEPDLEAEARLALSGALRSDGRLAEVLEQTDSGLARPGVSLPLRARLSAQRAQALCYLGDLGEAARCAAQASTLAARASDQLALGGAAHARTLIAFFEGRLGDALQAARQDRTGAGASPVDQMRRTARLTEALTLAALDRLDQAQAAFDEALREADRHGITWVMPGHHAYRGLVHLMAGRPAEAATAAETALQLAEELGFYGYQAQALAVLARAALLRGDLPRAQALLADAEQFARPRSDYGQALVSAAFLLAREAAKDHAGAASTVAKLCRDMRSWQLGTAADPGLLPAAVRVALHRGDTRLARRACELAAQLATHNPPTATLAGIAAHASGLLDGDADLLAAAVTHLQDSPRPLALASAAEDHGKLLAAKALRRPARTALLIAATSYEQAGAIRDFRRVRRRLRALGDRSLKAPARAPVTGWAALTSAEQRIARLVADGKTNRVIAQQLWLSLHTVNTHVRHIFVKLGIGSRVELARFVLTQAPRDLADGPA